jgi:hypothetical protein
MDSGGPTITTADGIIIGLAVATLAVATLGAFFGWRMWVRPVAHILFRDEWEIDQRLEFMVFEFLAEISGVGSYIVSEAKGQIKIRGKRVDLEPMFDQVGMALETGSKIGFMFKLGNENLPLPADGIVEVNVRLKDKTRGKFRRPVRTAKGA